MMNNSKKQQAFRCSAGELDELKHAFKDQMQQTYVNGRPFYGQLPSEVDDDGTLRDDMWQTVSDSREIFRSMLAGARWEAGKPYDLDAKPKQAKNKICTDYTAIARRSLSNSTATRSRVGKMGSKSGPSRSSSLRSPPRRTSERLRKKSTGRPNPRRLSPAIAVNDAAIGASDRAEDCHNSKTAVAKRQARAISVHSDDSRASEFHSISSKNHRTSHFTDFDNHTAVDSTASGCNKKNQGTNRVARARSASMISPRQEGPTRHRYSSGPSNQPKPTTHRQPVRGLLNLSARIQRAVEQCMEELKEEIKQELKEEFGR